MRKHGRRLAGKRPDVHVTTSPNKVGAATKKSLQVRFVGKLGPKLYLAMRVRVYGNNFERIVYGKWIRQAVLTELDNIAVLLVVKLTTKSQLPSLDDKVKVYNKLFRDSF